MIGQSVGSDASPLSCFLFRPRKRLEKRRKRSHTNVSNASITRTSRIFQAPLQTPLPRFHASINEYYTAKNGLGTIAPRLLSQVKVGTHLGSLRKIAHSGLHAETGGVSDGGGITTLGAFHTFRKPCVARCQNGKLCRFWVLAGDAPEERRKPAEQRCAYARRCSEASRPRWAALLCLQFGDVAVFSLCAQYFLNVRDTGGITTLGVLCVLLKHSAPACQSDSFVVF